MNNFRLIDKNIDVNFILEEISNAFKINDFPSDFGFELKIINAHKDTASKKEYFDYHKDSAWQHIFSAYRIGEKDRTQLFCDMNSNFLHRKKHYRAFPKTLCFLKSIADKHDSCLQRIIFAQLESGGEVLPHVDSGRYFKHRDRYHLVLKSSHGSEFTAGDEKQIFKEGELWWFNNKERHSVKNLNDSPRLHIIFDLLPKNHFRLREKIVYGFFSFFFQTYYDTFGKKKFDELLEKYPALLNILLTK